MKRTATIQLHPDADLQTLQSGATTLRADIRRSGTGYDEKGKAYKLPDMVYGVPMMVVKASAEAESYIALHAEADVATAAGGKQSILAEIRQTDPESGFEVVSKVAMELSDITEEAE